MHTGALKKWALALTFWLALHLSSLKAQIFSNDLPLQAITTGTNPVDFEFRADGTLIAKGNFGVGSLLSGDQGNGTRMLWFPSLGAFRAGGVTGANGGVWDAGNIGNYSVALGRDTTASGNYSTASGYINSATGKGSVAMGFVVSATSTGSVCLGVFNNTTGWAATVTGGNANTASGGLSTVSGAYNTATGDYSTVMGGANTASGKLSTASGYYTMADAYDSFVLGCYNLGGGNASAWVPTDPLFEVGNGGNGSGQGNPSASGPSDALVVYKNGNAVLQGTLQVAPGGDIPMYTGN